MKESNLSEGVSVVIPSIRPNHYLSRLLKSIEEQKALPNDFLEVIIVINGKEAFDVNSVEKEIEKLSIKHSVRVLYNSIGSVSKARNLGIEASSREFITFCDDDDWLGSKYISNLYDIADFNNIACAPIVNVTEDSKDYNSTVNTFLDTTIEHKLGAYSRVLTISACKLLPTKNIKKIKFDEKLASGEDVVYFSAYVSRYEPEFVHVSDIDSYYNRFVTDSSVSRQPLSYDFNIEQRVDVIERLAVIDSKFVGWIQTKVDGQLSFINKYYSNYPESENTIKGAFNKRGLGRLMKFHNNTFSLNLRGK